MTSNERIFQAEQISGKQIATQKLPSWGKRDDILYPVRLSMEQCSSEATAQYKAAVIAKELPTESRPTHLVDLTGGFGVDTSYLSSCFSTTDYVEQNAELCQIAAHNFQVLQLPIEVHHGQAEEFLTQTKTCDCIYMDPARRSQSGSKVFRLEDCTPNLVELRPQLLAKTRLLAIKLSPMLDITAALQVFPETRNVHIVSVKNECKEIVLLVRGALWEKDTHSSDTATEPRIHCTELQEKGVKYSCNFTFSEEASALVQWATPTENWEGMYLYEPGASWLKAGAFKWLSAHYGVQKLHPHSHLYLSSKLISDFPGKIFRIERLLTAHKKQLGDLHQANLSIRNFPGTVAALRKKLGLREGGETQLFATTLLNQQKVLIQTHRVSI